MGKQEGETGSGQVYEPKTTKMASQIPRMNSNSEAQELIDFDLNQGGLDYKLGPSAQHHDLSWLNVKNLNLQYTAPQKELKKPPSKKKRKVQLSKLECRGW